MTKRIGFIGLGDMGTPMARRLIDTGSDLGVWTRSAEKRAEFSKTGAIAAENPKQLFELCDVVIIMLASADVLDEVLERGTEQFNELVRDCILIQMGTTVPDYSRGLEADILKAGGRYAEVPVSGSSVPAASGQLVAMQAGDPETLMAIDAVIAPLIAAKVDCGPVPKALQMKLAVNTCLAGLMFGLVEGTNLARQCDLDMQVFRQVLEAGQLSSPVVKMKLPKLIDEDFSAQASVYQTGQNIAMILAAAKEVSAAMPIVEGVQAIQQRTTDLGFADKDVVATIKAYQQLNKI